MPTGPRYLIDEPSAFASQEEWVDFESGLAHLDQDDVAVHWAYQSVADFWADEWNPDTIDFQRRAREEQPSGRHHIQWRPLTAYAPFGFEDTLNCKVTRNWSPGTTRPFVLTSDAA